MLILQSKRFNAYNNGGNIFLIFFIEKFAKMKLCATFASAIRKYF
jgi:hypothetical protein